MKALFVYDADDLETPLPGGVQICSREYLAIVREASESCELLAVRGSRRLGQRLRRKFRLGSYLGYDPGFYIGEISSLLVSKSVSHVFLNQTALARFAPEIKSVSPGTKVVIMSHGNKSGDDLYEIASGNGRRSHGFERIAATWQLGQDVVAESSLRHASVDLMCVMSHEEAVLESWLGASHTLVLPRTITPEPLDWSPIAGRAGYVGTLDHTPNRVALNEVYNEISRRKGIALEIRLVGRPESAGREFAARFPFVRYLGPLSEPELREEARTWCLFLNPILWLSRGASMKLGVAVGWGLPILSTHFGARGYEWGKSSVPTTPDSAGLFVDGMISLLGSESALADARRAGLSAASAAPSISELARRLNAALEALR